MMDIQTVQEQKAWEHYKAIEEENFRLQKEVDKYRNDNKKLKHQVRVLGNYKKQNEERKQLGRINKRNKQKIRGAYYE